MKTEDRRSYEGGRVESARSKIKAKLDLSSSYGKFAAEIDPDKNVDETRAHEKAINDFELLVNYFVDRTTEKGYPKHIATTLRDLLHIRLDQLALGLGMGDDRHAHLVDLIDSVYAESEYPEHYTGEICTCSHRRAAHAGVGMNGRCEWCDHCEHFEREGM